MSVNNQPLFFRPAFQEYLWGGQALKEVFGYNIPSEITAECWGISAHENGLSVVMNGEHKGKSLKELWDNHRELFGNMKGDVFPLLAKILDANNDLSVQIHPDDEYAKTHAGEQGKTECWYIIDCEEGTEMVFGHHLMTKDQVEESIEKGEWSSFLRRVKIKQGDFCYVPSGTIHGLCKGTLVYEMQQNSDTTYRLYDYNRVDAKGNPRPLHLKESIDVMTIPHQDAQPLWKVEMLPGGMITTFIQNEFFSVYKYQVRSEMKFPWKHPFLLVSVIKGAGKLDDIKIKKGDHFILPAGYGDFTMTGELECIVSHV
jgi:mannose-6-phosphate isomerase